MCDNAEIYPTVDNERLTRARAVPRQSQKRERRRAERKNLCRIIRSGSLQPRSVGAAQPSAASRVTLGAGATSLAEVISSPQVNGAGCAIPACATAAVAHPLLVVRAVKRFAKTRIDPRDIPPLAPATFRRILSFVKPYWLRATGVVACMVVAAALNLASPWFVKRIVDIAIPEGNLRLLWLCCLGMIAGPLLAGFVRVVQKYSAEAIGQAVMLDLRTTLYARLHAMPIAFFTKQMPGEAVSHVLNDVQGVGDVVSGTLADIAQNSIVLASTVAFMMALDWRLALAAIAGLPLFIAPTRRVGRARKAIKRQTQARTTELTGIVTETLSISGALLVKVFDNAAVEVQRFRNKAEELRRLALEQSLVGRWFRMVLGTCESVGPAIIFALGGWLVVRGEVPLGTLVALVTVVKRLYTPASDLAGVHVDLMTSYAYFERVFELLDRTATIQDARGAQTIGRVAGGIEFRDVTFSYDEGVSGFGQTNAVSPALSHVTFNIAAGTTVGIVGSSGAGKSTLAALVLRLHDPTAGTVLVDGVDIRTVTSSSLRANIAVVTQETFLFHATVLENLRYGNPTATRAEVEDAARRAQIHDTVAALPDGYDTLVGERGYRFSGGERQRLAIARAILKGPRILILDEATSALDSVSERQVQESLAPLLAGRTNLIIAHRLSTIRDADVILVLDNGQLVEQGTHDELLARNGRYAWLWRSQARREMRPGVFTLPDAANAGDDDVAAAGGRGQIVALV
jgi:ATP-binding cassette subfamily B protein